MSAKRLSSIDIVRGYLLCIMAIDHVRSFVNKSHPSEFWGVPLPVYDGDLIGMLARVITHVCAPGFFLFLGTSMVLMAGRSPLPPAELRNHFIMRGLVLIGLQIFVVNIGWAVGGGSSFLYEVTRNDYGFSVTPGQGELIFIYWGVLSSLGLASIVCAFLVNLSNAVLLLLFVLSQGISIGLMYGFFLVEPLDIGTDYNLILRLLFIPGQSDFVLVRYALFPLVSLSMLGMLLGRYLERKQGSHAMALGFVLIFALVFVILRYLDIGDYHSIREQNIFEWLNLNKYPVSIVFQLFSLTLLALLFSLALLKSPLSNVMETFGQGTLFFYVVHIYLYGLMGYFFTSAASWWWVLVVWLIGLVMLYPMCQWWATYKKNKPYPILKYL